jgi:hypothetical protein
VLCKNIKEVSSVKELAELLIVQNNCMLPSVPEVAIVLKLFLTLPSGAFKGGRKEQMPRAANFWERQNILTIIIDMFMIFLIFTPFSVLFSILEKYC